MAKILLVIVGSISITACSGKGKTGLGAKHLQGIGDPQQFYGQSISPEQEQALLAKNIYTFGYDSFEVPEEDVLSLYAHAKKIMTFPKVRVRVEGHTDERGSREYNIALGERRAKAIANILMLKGASQYQVSIVSFGKEKPRAKGHDESAWHENRRAEIIYEME